MKLLIYPIIWITCAYSACGDEIILGKKLSTHFPDATKAINYEDIRNNKHLSISEVISHGDVFLKKSFGENFRPIIFSVCHTTARVKDGEIWCWMISYYHTDKDDDNLEVQRRFRVYLSPEGAPYMKVDDE